MSLVICALISCKYYRRPKNPSFMDDTDPRANSLYNVKTEIAFPKRVREENYRCSSEDVNAVEWSQEYEGNAPQSLSTPTTPESLRTQNSLKLKQASDTPQSTSPKRFPFLTNGAKKNSGRPNRIQTEQSISSLEMDGRRRKTPSAKEHCKKNSQRNENDRTCSYR